MIVDKLERTETSWADSAGQTSVYHQVAVDGGTLNVATYGVGPPLLLLHGWTLDHRIWRPQLEMLGSQYQLIMPDRRGFGRSTAPPDLTGELADIDRIAGHFGLQKFHLLGMSQAGVLAIAYALSRPEKVHALVTLGAPLASAVPGEDQIDRSRWGAMVRDGQIGAMRSEWLEHPLMQGLRTAARQLVEEIVGDYTGGDIALPTILPAITADQLGGLDMPLFALAGAQDTAWRIKVARFLASIAPAGSFGIVAEAGHLANIDNPERFNAQVMQFLQLFDNY